MKIATKEEYEYLHFLRGLFSSSTSLAFPKHIPFLSKTCIEPIHDMLKKGIINFLIRVNGWKKERSLKGNQSYEGRLWHRHDVLSLKFSENIMHCLANKGSNPQTLGDYIVEYIMARKMPVNYTSGLIALIKPQCKEYDFSIFMENSWLLEALQEDFAYFWFNLEHEKRILPQWDRVRDIGVAQEHVLNQFLSVIESTKRYDLARFLFLTMKKIKNFDFKFEQPTRFADRQDVWKSITLLPRILERMNTWYTASGYFDDDYVNTQLFKLHWEQYDCNSMLEVFRKASCDLDPIKREEKE